MKVLELFAGSRSFSKQANKMGHETFTCDKEPFDGIDYVCDIFEFDVSKVPFKPDIIWASPPCTYFSVASIGHHWYPNHTPKTENALLGVRIVEATLKIIQHFDPQFYFMENPRGKLRKLPVVKGIPRATVCYCQYGDTRMKPTDIWTNHLSEGLFSKGWTPRKMCFNGNEACHHQPAPRGSQTGTQGIKGNYHRSKIPSSLCEEIILSCSSQNN